MSVEKPVAKTLSPAVPGATPGASLAPSVAQLPAVSAPVARVAPNSSVPAFGGHRGGSKQRADGLLAGSPEAVAADKAANAERMRLARAAKRPAARPAALPSMAALAAATPSLDPAGAVAGSANPVSVPPSPTLVAWVSAKLKKPALLIVRVVDRVRQMSFHKRLDKLPLPPEIKKELKADMQWKEGAVTDFADALAECATIELNKRNVSAENAHWGTLLISSGELALAHIAVCERLDKLMLTLTAPAPPAAGEGKA